MGLLRLKNLGNTCYLNSVLQLLFNIHENQEFSVPVLDDIFQNINNKIIDPRSIKREISDLNPRFRGYQQHDALECLIFLWEYIHKFDKEIEKDTISFSIKRKKICHRCSHKTKSEESESYLLLSIHSCENIYDCLDLYFRDTHDQDSKYCEKCENNSETVSSKISFGNFLIVVLKRYDNMMRKNNSLVKINPGLRISSSRFELIGFVHHSGFLTCGHYVYMKKIKDKWFVFNDETIEDLRENDLEKYRDSAYIYLFEKISIH